MGGAPSKDQQAAAAADNQLGSKVPSLFLLCAVCSPAVLSSDAAPRVVLPQIRAVRAHLDPDHTRLQLVDEAYEYSLIDGINAIYSVLTAERDLIVVNLKGNNVGVVGARMLARVMAETLPQWVELNVAANALASEGIWALSEQLKICSTLTTLDLSDNHVGPVGAHAFADIIEFSPSLKKLGLANTGLRAEGTATVCSVLARNKTILELSLASNYLGDKGAKAVASMIPLNDTLTTLNLTGNGIESSGSRAILEALRSNHTLTSVPLSTASRPDEGAEAIAAHLKVNATLGSSLF
eukprot:c3080_g1_i1.p1 GENE.c3080_g1_i1~~c3080_g1_i1.p1  ORF type:complete len:296 (+),score=61.58 c3080_g1_i1:129-1016(+)